MRRYFYLLIILLISSCNNERVVQLPEIEKAEITEALDVSPIYIFYDETQPDSTLFNRKNLIGTTNWLVNVDKRLTLQQVIPHIQYLQKKRKKASMHKNENAKNYFTCNDTSIGSLGFVEFTDVNFITDESATLNSKELFCHVIIFDLSTIHLTTTTNIMYQTKIDSLTSVISRIIEKNEDETEFLLGFNNTLTFQDYIDLKTTVKAFEKSISKNEFIFHP
ncbi:hypothetical protein [uncultured Winogradskyella sp.]|uniref:hypothetical protein n=1 Tax=uncultured Winogradskyella sp. TaxID=395353 RepID=UPI00260291B2|nr:hypothetical protein [uncultured Winogradskyella sp.]